MKQFDWLKGFRAAIGASAHLQAKRTRWRKSESRRAQFERLEERHLLAADWGDAPDTGLGAGAGNYRTLASDNGPRHTIVAGLRMGASIDGYDGGVLQNATAHADDLNGALPDDEDGVANPSVDLTLTIGAQPTVNVWVANTTGTDATLYGWVDYNADGVFDNASERASVTVPDNTTSDIVTLVFPTVPSGFTGTTYARLRLSTDAAAENPTGAAADGEVEDYRATITERSSGIVASARSQKIGAASVGDPSLPERQWFGNAVASLGDLDGDGVVDIAVGSREYTGISGTAHGALYILFLNPDGSVKSERRITDSVGGGPDLPESNYFGDAVAPIGDLDGNGVSEIVVGNSLDLSGNANRGAVYVLFMNADGTVQSSQKIGTGVGGAPSLADSYSFGSAVAALGDFDGDGVNDMAVTSSTDVAAGGGGAVHLLMMNADGTVKSSRKIANGMNGAPLLANGDRFAASVCTLGDLDGDGISEIAVGASGDNTGNSDAGAVYVLFLNADGTVKSWRKIANGYNGSLYLDRRDYFGTSVAALSDIDGDGVNDLAVGATGDNTGSPAFSNYIQRGAVYVLKLNADGTVKGGEKIADRTGGGPLISYDYHFGYSVTSLGDLDHDGVIDLAVGARGDHTDGHGAVHVLPLQHDNDFAPQFTSPAMISVAENSATVMTVTAIDADLPPQALSFSIVGGVDRGTFEITSGGVLSFRWPRDFEVPTDADRDNVYEVIVQVSDGNSGITAQTISVSISDVSDPPSVDFGDAPDSTGGTGPGNYQTTAADNGPRHTIVAGLRIGAYVDADGGALHSAAANRDDTNGALPDDEDGLTNAAADLALTIGAAPSVNVWVTNTTGWTATLYGWIDYNADGVFVNATERSSVIVADGTVSDATTLVFPAVPNGYTGTTYARFRLSTDASAASAVGAATDGEVEDLQATIVAAGTGRVDGGKTVRLTHNTNGGPALVDGDRFGRSVASIGDLDGDGIIDLAVGADQYEDDYNQGGAVYVLFMNADGTVKSSQKIASDGGGGPTLANSTFGTSLASLGDLDGDGVTDIAVGDSTDSFNGQARGAVYVLFLNSDGTVKKSQRIASEVGGGPELNHYDQMGHSLAAIGDLDGDGVTELAVGAPGDSTADDASGAVYVLFLASDGTAKANQKIAHETGGGPTLFWESHFGTGVASLGDFDGDGINDLAVGAQGDDGSDTHRGMAYIVLLNTDGTAKSSQRISDGPPLADYDGFGNSVASLGDLDGDGVTDIAVAASQDDTGGRDRGALYVLLLNSDGTTKARWKIADNTNGGPSLPDYGRFGRGIAPLGDLDGDGIIDIAVGGTGGTYDDVGDPYGWVHVLFLKPMTPDYGDAPDAAPGNGRGNHSTAASDNGPSHGIVSGLRLGGGVDSDSGALQNAAANADNSDGMMPSDEDGLVNPAIDLQLTVGTVSNINLWVTNTTGAAATLYGWIDYNSDGILDNLTERASAAVAAGTSSAIATLIFPSVPSGTTGATYARFRLSTDAAAANPTGHATDGEVEDYLLHITAPSSGLADAEKTKKLARNANGFPDQEIDMGDAVASVGDLDGDGVTDLVVGAGYTLFMNADGTVKRTQWLGEEAYRADIWGDDIAALGDVDGDGVTDIAVSGFTTRFGWYYSFVSIVYMNADGTAKQYRPILTNVAVDSLAGVGDLDGDGVPDLAIGNEQYGDDYTGDVHVLMLNVDGSVKAGQTIASGIGGGPSLAEDDLFGSAITSLGDIDGDGISDLAVAAIGDETGAGYDEYRKGAVYVLLLNADGTARSNQKIADDTGGGPSLDDDTNFGVSLASLGDLDGDGVTDIAVGAVYDDTGGGGRGALHLFFLNADGTAKATRKIADRMDGGPALADWANFGSSVTSLGDLDGDGITDIAVGAYGDNDGDGAVYVLFLEQTRLSGDYNEDGIVDSGDYVVWRKSLNSSVTPTTGADGNGDGYVDQADLQVWKVNFGATMPAPVVPPATPVDYGDAPDTGTGTGAGNYATLLDDDGPRHAIVEGLHLGASVDHDAGALQNAAASVDDIDGGLPDDEDGLANPTADLVLTVGAQPTVSVWVTNTTDAAATLYGWIDFNADGVFDNASERASAAVPDGTISGLVTLVFLGVPEVFTGETYARFRLSTDAVAGNPTGPAADGEVEDYRATIRERGVGQADAAKTAVNDIIGYSMTAIGDLNRDGVPDLAFGDEEYTNGGLSTGAVRIAFMNADGTVKSSQLIASGVGGGATLANGDAFGTAVAAIGDLDADGITEIAVGATGDNAGGWFSRGAVYVLFMDSDGSVKRDQKIADDAGDGPYVGYAADFGSALAPLGDLDGDGIGDLAVGASSHSNVSDDRGAVFVLFMNAAGTVKRHQQIGSNIGGGPMLVPGALFGSSLAALEDVDGDGIGDLAVGARNGVTINENRGVIHVLFMNTDGTVKQSQKIGDSIGGGPPLADGDDFGGSIASLGDLDGDGISDIAVGNRSDDTGGYDNGAVYVLSLNADGTAKSVSKLAHNTSGGPSMDRFDEFGRSVASVGDLDGDGVTEIAVSSISDDLAGGTGRGAVFVLFLEPAQLAGDYNLDAVVNSADYIVWRKTLGSTGIPVYSGGDGDGDGDVDANDLELWKAHYGETLPSPSSGSGTAAANSTSTPGELSQESVSVMVATQVSAGPETLPEIAQISALPPMVGPLAEAAFETLVATERLSSVTLPQETIAINSPPVARVATAEQDLMARDLAIVALGQSVSFAAQGQMDFGRRETRSTRPVFAPTTSSIQGRDKQIVPQRIQLTFAAGRAKRTSLDFDALRLADAASLMDDKSHLTSEPARAGRGQEDLKHAALDDVFGDLGRHSSRRRRARPPMAVS